MDGEFVPKKTITVQITLDTQRKIEELAEMRGVTRTKLIEQIVTEAYSNDLSRE